MTVEVLQPDNTPVDKVDPIVIDNISQPVGQVSWTNRECIDPRFNAYPAQWTNVPNAPSHGMGKTNTCTKNWWQANPDGDTNSEMYVRNERLQSVGELGYLAYAPWKTVKLYGPGLYPVLAHFAIGTNDADVYVTHARRGLINPNSWEVDALAAIFADMPVDDYPGESPAYRLTMQDARDLVNNLGLEAMTNLSDFGRAMTNFSGLGVTFDSELKKESMFRNACGLMSVRQNLFTILIEAQVASGGGIPRNAARQRAVAIVWRDPYTGEFFVRSFQWLED